jgi:uncharacterized membrane protein
VHIVGFIIRIYHDARSSECQIYTVTASSLQSMLAAVFVSYLLGIHHKRAQEKIIHLVRTFVYFQRVVPEYRSRCGN